MCVRMCVRVYVCVYAGRYVVEIEEALLVWYLCGMVLRMRCVIEQDQLWLYDKALSV